MTAIREAEQIARDQLGPTFCATLYCGYWLITDSRLRDRPDFPRAGTVNFAGPNRRSLDKAIADAKAVLDRIGLGYGWATKVVPPHRPRPGAAVATSIRRYGGTSEYVVDGADGRPIHDGTFESEAAASLYAAQVDAATVADRADRTVWRVTAADLDALAGRALTDDELARVANAIDHSTANESIAAAVDQVA